MNAARPLEVFVVAGEASGDQLGEKLMAALDERTNGQVRFRGVGGAAMARRGLSSLFPIADIALVGFLTVLKSLPLVLRRIDETVRAIVAAPPDVLVLIDSPDFNHRVGRRVRKALPNLPIVVYVSPTVWAWRPGRAPAMARWCDRVLALLPFEPAAHAKLGGPPCTYVGHPLVERLDMLRPDAEEAARRAAAPPLVLVLPGSRRAELHHLLPVFGATLTRLRASVGAIEAVLPTLPHLRAQIEGAIRDWPERPHIVDTDAEKFAAFRRARVALAASGTVTLELALAGVPTVASYRGTAIEAFITRRLLRVNMVVLPNLVIGEMAMPELLQEDCTPDKLAAALLELLDEGPVRARQIEAFARVAEQVAVGTQSPSQRAADAVLETLERFRVSRKR